MLALTSPPPLVAHQKKKKQCVPFYSTQSLSLSSYSSAVFRLSPNHLQAMAATTTTAASLACAHFLNQNKVYAFPAKTSVQVSQIIDGRKTRSATLFSAASTDKAVTTAQSVSPTACDRCVRVFTSRKGCSFQLMGLSKNRVFLADSNLCSSFLLPICTFATKRFYLYLVFVVHFECGQRF